MKSDKQVSVKPVNGGEHVPALHSLHYLVCFLASLRFAKGSCALMPAGMMRSHVMHDELRKMYAYCA